MAAMNATFGEFDSAESTIILSTNKHDKILDDTYIDVTILRSTNPKMPDMKILSKLPRIGISLGAAQVEELAALYAGNMNESPQFVYGKWSRCLAHLSCSTCTCCSPNSTAC
jgi:hypothetical protein